MTEVLIYKSNKKCAVNKKMKLNKAKLHKIKEEKKKQP